MAFGAAQIPRCYIARMGISGRPSSREDREIITQLMQQELHLAPASAAIEPAFLEWKYWQPHPLCEGSRGYVLQHQGRIVSHGCRWPIRLRTSDGDLDSCHLIDWVADPNIPGAGMKALHECASGMSAMFSIGGSAVGQRVVSAFGFQPIGQVWVLARPLHALNPAWGSSPRDWKFAARLIRNAVWKFLPRSKLASGWRVEPVPLSEIPEGLFPRPTVGQAVSARSAPVLNHMAGCPSFVRFQGYTLSDSVDPIAYFVLAQVRKEVRLIDFGPAGLNADMSQILGAAVQQVAPADFPTASSISTAATETAVREGLLRSGFRDGPPKIMRVLALKPEIRNIPSFRLTMIDWDIACL